MVLRGRLGSSAASSIWILDAIGGEKEHEETADVEADDEDDEENDEDEPDDEVELNSTLLASL